MEKENVLGGIEIENPVVMSFEGSPFLLFFFMQVMAEILLLGLCLLRILLNYIGPPFIKICGALDG